MSASTHPPETARPGPEPGTDFLRQLIADDLAAGRHSSVVTRFPPEPNGYLHIGHAKSIALNFGVAAEFGGRCHLRFDDTNPETEEQHYVDAILDTVRWLGFDWGEHLYFASDYFERMYECAEALIREGKAYVDDASEEEVRAARGTVTEPGRPTPSRSRTVEENLDLFRRMRAGEFPDGACVLRARIDLASPNMLMRDPVLYRIRHATHYRQGDAWCIYPLYDWAHPLEDAFEHVTHSFCTLEFENNRELYDWIVENAPVPARPRQTEFARLALDYTVMSKRRLLELVKAGHVTGWDDPRIPSIAGLRRRGVTPEAIRSFAAMVGVTRNFSRVDIGKLEFAIRDDLNTKAPRVMAVSDPLRVVITNWPADRFETIDAPLWPRDVPREGSRDVPFSGTLWIERADFMEDPPKGFHRLAPGREVRLRYAWIICCDDVVKDEAGEIVELRCSYDPDTAGGDARGRTVKGTLHWVSTDHAVPCELRLYDRLFRVPDPDAAAEESGGDFTDFLNPDSLVVRRGFVEPSIANEPPGSRYQFERLGYFMSDTIDSKPGALVFNRTVPLRDTWTRQEPAPSARKVESRPPTPDSRPSTRAPRQPSAPPTASERKTEHGLDAADAALIARDGATMRLFEGAVAAGAPARMAANWIIHELPREVADRSIEELPFDGEALARLIELIDTDVLNSTTARDVLAEMVATGASPDEIVERRGLTQIRDSAILGSLVDEAIGTHPDRVAAYRGGRTGLLGFFMGQVMNRTGGRADPELVRRLLTERLDPTSTPQE